jgi:hypothetical protein
MAELTTTNENESGSGPAPRILTECRAQAMDELFGTHICEERRGPNYLT